MRFKPVDLENVRVALFDVYGTLLRTVPRTDTGSAFSSWWRAFFSVPVPGYLEFKEKIRAHIGVSHAHSRAAGVEFPEVQWPQIVQATLGEYGVENSATYGVMDDIAASLVEVEQKRSLMPGAATLLGFFLERRMPLGIVSNAQSYTSRHLKEALVAAGIVNWPFDEAWSFWSWKFGFSKPSPAVFQIFSARAGALGWSRSQILFFGDCMDKDILPARAAGWRSVHVEDLNSVPVHTWS